MGAPSRRISGKVDADRFSLSLLFALLMAPIAIALALSGWSLRHPGFVSPVSRDAVLQVPSTAVKSAATQTVAVLRPHRASPEGIERLPANAAPQAMLAVAFMPQVDTVMAYAAPLRASRQTTGDALTTASMPPVAPGAKSRGRDIAERRWAMQTLRSVGVARGLRLIANGEMIELAGVMPLQSGAICKRLDGVEEACEMRAAARLEVLTRGRLITCRVYEAAAGQARVGACKADKIDLADDLVRNGLARRVDA